MEIVIGIVVGLLVGAGIAVIVLRNAKQGSLREADSRLESARAEANQVIGDAQRQAETLKKLQSNEHEVLTGYVIQKDDRILKEGIVTSRLYIAPMSDEEIWRYVDTKSPMDKAGSYGVQDREYIHSEIREGYAENIMGFPVREIEKDLKELKIL